MRGPVNWDDERVGRWPFLLFLCTVPLGNVTLAADWAWLTPTKLGFLALAAYLACAAAKGWRPRPQRALLAGLGFWMAGGALSFLFSADRATSGVFLLRVGAAAALCLITAWLAAREKDRRVVLGGLLAVGGALAVLGIYQTRTGRTLGTLGVYGYFGRLIDLFYPTEAGGISVTRASGAFDHPNLFGAFLIAAIPFGLAGLGRAWHGWRVGLPVLAATILCLVALVYTFSRGAWIGLAAGLCLLAARRSLRWGGLALVGVAVAAAVLLLPAEARTVLLRRGGGVQPYDAGRLYSYRVAGRMIADRPWTGVGLGRFHDAYRAYAKAGEDYHQNPLHRMDAHNTLLDLGAEGGVPTQLAFAAVVALAGRALLRALRRPRSDARTHSDPWSVAATAAGLAGVLVQSLTQSLEYEEVLWILLGLCAGAAGRSEATPRPVSPGPVRSVT
jgi:O-antigen ligase